MQDLASFSIIWRPTGASGGTLVTRETRLYPATASEDAQVLACVLSFVSAYESAYSAFAAKGAAGSCLLQHLERESRAIVRGLRFAAPVRPLSADDFHAFRETTADYVAWLNAAEESGDPEALAEPLLSFPEDYAAHCREFGISPRFVYTSETPYWRSETPGLGTPIQGCLSVCTRPVRATLVGGDLFDRTAGASTSPSLPAA